MHIFWLYIHAYPSSFLQARSYIQSLPHYPKKDFHKFFVGANSVAINLLELLLTMDPDRRPTAEQALEHPYFGKYHILEDEVGIYVAVKHRAL